MKKQLKASQRGLTFSLNQNEVFKVGTHYRYFIENNQIVIVPEKEGTLIVSKKKVGKKIKPLFDLRSKGVKELVSKATCIEVVLEKNQIIVHTYEKKSIKANYLEKKVYAFEEVMGIKKSGSIILFSEAIRMASGGECFSQLTFSDYLQSLVQEEQTNFNSVKIKEDLPKVFSVVSLFSGCGLLDYPFSKDNAFNIVFANDYNKYACESYKQNIGNHILCKSIHDIQSSEVPKADIVCGGISCKPYAAANRHEARLSNHIDSQLPAEYVRITKEVNPSVFVIENVPSFITAAEGEYFNIIKEGLLEYEISYQIVTDSEIGGFTKRKRVIIIGSKIGKIELPNIKVLPYKTVKEALSKVDTSWVNYDDISVSRAETVEKMKLVPPGGNFKNIPDLANCNSHSNRFRRLSDNELCPTLVNWRKLPLLHPEKNRILSVAEAIALSGFGKEISVVGPLDEKQQQIGNGVTYAIGNLIKNNIKKCLMAHYENKVSII